MAPPPNDLLQKAQQYLRSAAVLLELEDFDSCASRAYFAMFYAAQGLVIYEQGQLPTTQGIRSAFYQLFIETGRLPARAADMLDRGYGLQEKADYSSQFALSREEAEQTLQEAEAFVIAAERLLGQA